MKLSKLVLPLVVGLLSAAEPPVASISNGVVQATLHLPDSANGYYRGTRFDWSGSIASLEAAGHTYFGQWFARYDPTVHDSITGPVEDYAPLNFTEAKPGDTFLKIGVGVLKRLDEQPYRFSAPYDLVDSGKWTTRPGADFIEYRHELADPKSGYAYVYTKTVRLTPNRAQMTIEHNLRNTGSKVIDTNVYNHGFFMLDAQPTGPDFTVKFPFALKPAREMAGLAEVHGNEIVYVRELQENVAPASGGAPQPGQGRSGRQQASTLLDGFSRELKDFDIRIENKKTGAGVRITADRPLSRLNFWSIRTTVCPEAYVDLKVAPEEVTSWRLIYDFYSLPR